MKNQSLCILITLLILLISGCGNFEVKQLAKSDIDFVIDAHRQQSEQLLYELLEKLYKRNPDELAKQSEASIDVQTNRLKAAIQEDSPLLIDGIEGVALLQQAFADDFKGDRVFTLVGGLLSMLHKSYGYHVEFFMFDTLDQQKLYNAARNIEVSSWRLRTSKKEDNTPLLLSTELTGETTNLSFERLIAKLVSMQDMIAIVASDGGRRTVNGVAQGVAKAVFLPI